MDTKFFSSQERASKFYAADALSLPLASWERLLNNNLMLPSDLKTPTATTKTPEQ